MALDEVARNKWLAHWTQKALDAIEAHLAGEKETAAIATATHRRSPTLPGRAVIAPPRIFKCDVSTVPTAMRIYGECMKLPAFERAHPLKQPDAPMIVKSRKRAA